jgi:hypothetical protein
MAISKGSIHKYGLDEKMRGILQRYMNLRKEIPFDAFLSASWSMAYSQP